MSRLVYTYMYMYVHLTLLGLALFLHGHITTCIAKILWSHLIRLILIIFCVINKSLYHLKLLVMI